MLELDLEFEVVYENRRKAEGRWVQGHRKSGGGVGKEPRNKLDPGRCDTRTQGSARWLAACQIARTGSPP
jgi:hypothetical protein